MKNLDKLLIVKERLNFILEISKIKEHFRGIDKAIKYGPTVYDWSHPYENFSALRFYLILTCFDILGQTDEWSDYDTWLVSNAKKNERENIFNKHREKDLNKLLISINKDYKEIYGVKKSFVNFIRKIISDKNRGLLYASISGIKLLTESSGGRIDLTDKQKEDFLFKIRNSFTHKGISIGDKAGGIFDLEKPLPHNDKNIPKWFYQEIHRCKLNGDHVAISVRKWPLLLIEIVEGTVKELEEKHKNLRCV